MVELYDKFSSEISLINKYLEGVVSPEKERKGLVTLTESMRYSLNLPGKRFRALLALLTARALEHELNLVLPYAAAVELIHAYSLIHDDLPCMDDDDYRRGQPSNHKVFGESMAVIAGDGLQTLAFELIAENYQQMPRMGLQASLVLAKASGYRGMVGGQAMDVAAGLGYAFKFEELKLMHNLKTGALIRAAIEGAAILCEASEKRQQAFTAFGENLGLAFQVADDLLDHHCDNPEPSGFPRLLGLEKTQELLEELTQKAQECLKPFSVQATDLIAIAQFNLARTKGA